MRLAWGAVVVGIAIFVGCTGGADSGSTSSSSASSGGSSSGASSSSTSSSTSSGGSNSSSGNVTYTTTCSPELAMSYFDGAIAKTDESLSGAPCPQGYRAKNNGPGAFNGSFPAPERYTSEAELIAEYCDVESADAGVSSPAIDWGTSDVVVALMTDFSSTTMLARGGELWIRRSYTQCTGAASGAQRYFYVVPKGTELKVQSCTTTCTCTPGPCQFA